MYILLDKGDSFANENWANINSGGYIERSSLV